MPLKSTSDLLFYTDRDAKAVVTDPYLIGLFRSQYCQRAASRGVLGRWLSPTSFTGSVPDDTTFVACAMVETVVTGEQQLPTIHMCTVGADEGYGPTLYAAILQFARNEELAGVLPSVTVPSMPPRPKAIWRQFSEAYDDKISLAPATQQVHAEPWLNHVYALKRGEDLVDLAGMRQRYGVYMRHTRRNDWVLHALRSAAYEMAHKRSDGPA